MTYTQWLPPPGAVAAWLFPVAIASTALGALLTEHVSASPDAHGSTSVPVGALAPDFGLKQLDASTGELGTTVWLGDFVGQRAKTPKRLVLLNFFATWCAPCKAELPLLARLQRELGAKGLQVLAVNFRRATEELEPTLADAQALMQKNALGYPVLFDRYTTRNQQAYVGESGALPCNVLIGADGRVLARLQGAEAEPNAIEAAVRGALGGDS